GPEKLAVVILAGQALGPQSVAERGVRRVGEEAPAERRDRPLHAIAELVEVGGSQIILSPVGSKALAVGALMAALDRDFTIMYVEALGYDVDLPRLDAARSASPGDLVHVWLHGEAYPPTGSREAAGS